MSISQSHFLLLSGLPSSVYSATQQDSTEDYEEDGQKRDYPWNSHGFLEDKRTPQSKDLSPREDQQQFIDSLGLKRPDLYGAEVRISL